MYYSSSTIALFFPHFLSVKRGDPCCQHELIYLFDDSLEITFYASPLRMLESLHVLIYLTLIYIYMQYLNIHEIFVKSEYSYQITGSHTRHSIYEGCFRSIS